MERSVLIMMSVSDSSVLAVLAESECDLGLVAYEMTLLGNQAGTMLSPLARGLR
jgi:predicted regulator of Ras-like GTPase activity (Roadblock/LC7/MglB family)